MNFTWVIGAYSSKTDQGKSVVSHANAGVGYYDLNKNRPKGSDIIVGFKWSHHNQPLPNYLAKASTSQIAKLEEMERKRNGINDDKRLSAQEIFDVFPAKQF